MIKPLYVALLVGSWVVLVNANLTIFSTSPAYTRWPVQFAAALNGSQDYRFVWTFPGISDQTCTVNGQPGKPCIGPVVEKTWSLANRWRVEVRAFFQDTLRSESSINVLVTPNATCSAIRREIRQLSQHEWIELVNAFYTLKANGVYDHFVFLHRLSSENSHSRPAFLPWHRIFILLMEQALQAASGNRSLGLPYWDWTDNSVALWNDTWFGPNGDPQTHEVSSGPFCSRRTTVCAGKWPVALELGGPYLLRDLDDGASLPTRRDVQDVMRITSYDTWPYNKFSQRSFRNSLEGWGTSDKLHNLVHAWVGGSMKPMTSPNDPLFFFHHCFVDMIWLKWQRLQNCYGNCYRPSRHDNTLGWLTPGAKKEHGEWRLPGQQWGNNVFPWDVGPADVADATNSIFGYDYL